MVTKQQFNDFLADIEPSPTTKANASSAHTELRDFVAAHEKFKERHLGTFLAGSHARNTGIRPQFVDGETKRPDVDVIVVTNHTKNDKPQDVIDELFKVVRDFASKLEEDDRPVSIRKQRRSVHIEISSADMDLVPIIAPFGLNSTLYIPDRDKGEWLETNPPKHTDWATKVNADTGKRFKPLVKLFKWWRRENTTVARKPKGFMMECFVANCMSRTEEKFGELFVSTMEKIVSEYSLWITLKTVPSLPDPAVITNNVLSNVTFAAFEGFYNKAKEHAAFGRKALNEEDPEKSVVLWRKIFGDRFPASAGAKSASLISNAVAASPFTFPNRPIVPNKPKGFA